MKINIKSILVLASFLLFPLGQANAYVLGNWNDVDLDVSGDSILVNTGIVESDTGGNTWFSMQWQAGSDNTLTALGIDQVYYNFDGASASGDVLSVWEGSIDTGTDLSALWSFNKATTTSGGGFGDLSSKKNMDPAGTDGIDPSILYFVLDGLVDFAPNEQGSTFTAHVRYGDDCSGWASDGISKGQSSGSCGSTTTVPEPGAVGLLAMGLFGIVIARRRFIV